MKGKSGENYMMITYQQNARNRNSKSQIKSELPRKKEFSKKAILRDGQKKVFTVSEVRYADPITYKIVDYINEKIQGTF